MKQKILLVGSKGMAGNVILKYFKTRSGYDIIDIARDDAFFKPTYKLDVSNFEKLKSILALEKPDVVINCIGVLNKDAEDNPAKAVLLNSYLPHFLAAAGTELLYKLIHISTDCVFSGSRGGYNEDDFKDGNGYYAQSKALGEVTYHPHLTFRTSIIGPDLKADGIGLFNWFIHQQDAVKGYTNAFWTGVTTLELAKAIDAAIQQNIQGLYHLVNNEKISKYDLLSTIASVFGIDTPILPFSDYKVDKSLINNRSDFQFKVSSYEVMLTELKHWMSNYSDLNYTPRGS